MDIDLSALSVEELRELQKRVAAELTRRGISSDLKPGDRVRHKRGSFEGIGEVIEIAKSGLRAKVAYNNKYGRWWAYYTIDMLVRVDDDGF